MPNQPQDHHLPVQKDQDILWGDMDEFGHINNTVYFRYFEDIRMIYFEKVGIMEYKQQHNIGPILANTQCQFRLPLTYPDTITISTSTGKIEGKRFMMEYKVYSQQHQKLAAEGNGLIIFYDYERKKSCEVPESIKQTIEKIEHKKKKLITSKG